MMRNEGARMEIMIAALFALVVYQQVQIAHLNARLINVLEIQVVAARGPWGEMARYNRDKPRMV